MGEAAKYYETEGHQDAVRIEFPKGQYTPVFRCPVEVREVPPPAEALPPEGEIVPAPGIEPAVGRTRRRWQVAAVSGLLILVAAGVLAAPLARRRFTCSPIAVLPFVNLNRNSDDFLGDGLTEDLIDSLARVPGVRVVARTSSFQYNGKTSDVRKIGRELNVRTVLEGTVRLAGNRLRITALLSDTSSGYQLWSESYDRKMKDALAVQREISNSIATALGLEFARNSGGTSGNSGRNGVNPEAYEAYLKAAICGTRMLQNL